MADDLIELSVAGPHPSAERRWWGRWDRFVAAHPWSAFAHLHGHLLALAETTRYRPRAVLLRAGQAVRATLAWVEGPPPLRRAVSLPFYEYGGPLLADDVGPEEVRALLAAAGRLDMRMAHGWHGPEGLVTRRVEYDYATIPLDHDPEIVFRRASPKQARWAVGRAQRLGVEVVRNPSAAAVARDFYPVYLRWMRDRHASPPLPLAYWQACQRHLPGTWQLFQARHQGRLVAQFAGFVCGGRVSLTTTISDAADYHLQANDLALWSFIEWACRAGCRWFDLGALRYGGQRRFKEKWGGEVTVHERVLYDPSRPAEVGDALPAPESPAFDLARRAWRRLPLAWTERLGPPLREWLTL